MIYVLVADDDRIITTLVKAHLSRLGHDVDIANDGGEAVSMAKAKNYDLIILDGYMPVLSGAEVAKALRVSGNASAIVMLSASVSCGCLDCDHCVECGIDHFMPKPYNAHQMTALISELF
jgi:DNA-binding response OmpR family regulator